MASEPRLTATAAQERSPGADPIRQSLDRRLPWIAHGEPFSAQLFGAGPFPEQGWKLHVSATPESGPVVLERVLPVLLAAGVRFKAVNSVGRLMSLNNGLYGASQVGKFITVYPSDDAQAVALAVSLDAAARGLVGPRVPSDRPLRQGSLVHYRYGAFQTRGTQEGGIEVYDLQDSQGRLTSDQRQQFYVAQPTGIEDPFEAAGVCEQAVRPAGALGGRYLVVDVLARTYRGGVFRVIDLGVQPARVCLLKEFWHDVGADSYGRDARDWGENEAAILAHHAGDPRLPRFDGRFELDGNLYIALEYVEGKTLARNLKGNHGPVSGLASDELARIGRGTGEILADLHRLGVVYRDFKPDNVVCTPDGHYRLIDFGLAWEPAGAQPALEGCTPLYSSPQQYAGAEPGVPDDVFAWGAVMHELATGRLIGQIPEEERQRPVARQPLAPSRPDLPPAVCSVIDRATAWDAADRFQGMDELLAAFSEALVEVRTDAVATSRPETVPNPPVCARAGLDEDPLALARQIGDAIRRSAEERSGGLCWATRAEGIPGDKYDPDLYDGAAGIALVLAELTRATGDPAYAEAARGAARWLMGPPWAPGRARPGLHCGEAGVGYLFIRLASLLSEPGYLQAAELRARRMADIPFATLDLLYGAAGAAIFLVRLAAASGSGVYLDQARIAGDLLLEAARPSPDGAGCYWEVSAIDPSLPALPYLGLAHGAAGIGLALAELADSTGDERYLDSARTAADLLVARGTVSDDGAWRWPRDLRDPEPELQAQCHGATGIGQFLLRLARTTRDERYLTAVRGAALTAEQQLLTETRSGVCHGLAGHGAFLLDCYQALGDERFLASARRCGRRLAGFGDADRPGLYRMGPSETVSPGLMLGYAGICAFYLRLAEPERQKDLLLR